MQRGLRVITLQGAIDKSPIFLSQYWKNELLDGTIIISYFSGSNNIYDIYEFTYHLDVDFPDITRWNEYWENWFLNTI